MPELSAGFRWTRTFAGSRAISFDRQNSATDEAFRKLRPNLRFLSVDNPPPVIVVASSLPGVGESTTTINIALALATAEHNMALVDGDMRLPMLGKCLDLVGSVGFSTVPSGKAFLEVALPKTRFPGLTVLTAGTVLPNPSELLGSLAAQKVLGELRADFDYVIVDSSPLLAVTDAAILAADSDGVLIMTRFGQIKREQLAYAVGNLGDVGAPLLGAVFTMTPPRGTAAYGYRYYGDDRAGKSHRETPAEPTVRDPAPPMAYIAQPVARELRRKTFE